MVCGKDQIVDFRPAAVSTDLRGCLNLAHNIRWQGGSVPAVFTRQRPHPALSFLQNHEV